MGSHEDFLAARTLFDQLQHDEMLSPQQQADLGVLPTRLFIHFVSVFHVLQAYSELCSQQAAIINNLEDRLHRLELAVSTGQQLTLPARQSVNASWPTAIDPRIPEEVEHVDSVDEC